MTNFMYVAWHLEHFFFKKHLEYVHVGKGIGGSEALRRYLCSSCSW